MLEAGLLEEVKFLIPFKNLNALNTVGYKEYFKYFDNELSIEEATELLKKNTRNYAKRQLTWYRKDKLTQCFEPKEIELITEYIHTIINV